MSHQYANQYGYSDITPYEIVRFMSDKTIEVREMDAEKDAAWKPEFHAGGFAAHCSNQNEQKWIITKNENNPIVRIRLQKNGIWKSAHGNKFQLSDTPKRFYDYNF